MDILHHQIVLVSLLKKVKNRHRVGMYQRRGSPRLATEALDRFQIIFIQGAQNFNCDKTFNAMVPRLKNTGHTTSCDMFTDLIASAN